MKYRKKPVVVEAFKWTADINQTEDPVWMLEALECGEAWFENCGTKEVKLVIKTLEGNHIANPGDYIIKGIKGELYPCKPDIFEQTYETVE